jgi:hypothetical protein
MSRRRLAKLGIYGLLAIGLMVAVFRSRGWFSPLKLARQTFALPPVFLFMPTLESRGLFSGVAPSAIGPSTSTSGSHAEQSGGRGREHPPDPGYLVARRLWTLAVLLPGQASHRSPS